MLKEKMKSYFKINFLTPWNIPLLFEQQLQD